MAASLQERLGQRIAEGGPLPFVDFCAAALYDAEEGYYAADRLRAGADRRADFVTNLAVRSVFAPLVIEALAKLCPGDPGGFDFLEIGAEPDAALLDGIDHPFRSAAVARWGQPLPRPAGPALVFANEWLDARPFVRLRFAGGRWEESMVDNAPGGGFREVFGPPASGDAGRLVEALPGAAPEGYRIDLSLEAEDRLAEILSGEWTGVFLTFDYGSSWESLSRQLPGGTARSYRSHSQTRELLADPGGRDLTCNVCWDRLAGVLRRNGFSADGPERQEAFFFRHADAEIRRIVEGRGPNAAERRARLQQILNPAHFGAAFQALWGVRADA